MTDLGTMAEARQVFLDLVADVRPELHRYCARMTGSVFDGEDVVQDTLAKAYYALAEMESPPPLRPWLFRIAHNTAMDFLRRYERRNVDETVDIEAMADMTTSLHEERGPDGDRVEAALATFTALPPLQRSALALKDVVGFSLEETAATMGTTVSAVKAALVRARATIAAGHAAGAPDKIQDLERLRRYADLFNARDWTALRAFFDEETRLDVVSRYLRQGRSAVQYFTRLEEIAPLEALHVEPGWVGDVPVLAMFRPLSGPRPTYFIRIDWRDERIEQIRDFRYIPYIASEAVFTPAGDRSKNNQR